METKQTSLDQTHFRYLKAEEIENPFIYINEFCEKETEMYYFRRDTLYLIKTAFSYDETFLAGCNSNYAYSQKQLIKVIETMYVLHHADMDLKPGNIRNYENSYKCLERDERNNLRVFLDDFFGYKDLDGWHELLDDLLIYAYKEGGEGFFDYADKPFKTMDYFEKLVEAIFLIYEIRHLKDSYPKASTDAIKETIHATDKGESDGGIGCDC
ncbi:hypothetical protein [Parapedobacter tibetensis]|uniref:hypothetical protein n=1 Tax=Parapedobacter tibetensis TaxID=2972951 RepID=UPI00214D1DFF|nr:hypothetical protein [Parapedobacter tibetensis]